MVEKEFIVTDKCVECKFCIHEHDMWLCLHHKIDVEEYDTSECNNFEKGCTLDPKYRLNGVKNELESILRLSKNLDKNFYIEYTFIFNAINDLKDGYLFKEEEE